MSGQLTRYKVNEYLDEKRGAVSLDMSNNDFNEIASDAFSNASYLELINLSKNSIRSLQPEVLDGMDRLTKVILSFNLITSLDDNIFVNCNNLEQLEITNCGLRTIGENAFNGLYSLKRLILAYNDLEFIETNTFARLGKLELLVLSFNKIKALHHDTFTELANLERLNLKANSLKTLHPQIFSSLGKLEQIILSVNDLHTTDNLFLKCHRLARIFIHTNKIERLTGDSFRGVGQACLFIDLGSNSISHMEANAFHGLVNLEYLDLSKNQLKSLDRNLFSNLSKLEELILSKNSISNIDSSLFRFTPRLKVLRFDFNKITYIDPSTFKNHQPLAEIYCNTLSVENMKSLQENIIKINKQKFIDDVTFIASFKEPEQVFSNEKAFEAVQRISLFSSRHKLELLKQINASTVKRFTRFVTSGVEHLYQNLSLHIGRYKPFVKKTEALLLQYLNFFTSIIKNWTKTFLLFCGYFHEFNGIQWVVNYLNSDTLKDAIIAKISDDSKYTYQILISIYGNLLSTLYNLLKKEDKKFKVEILTYSNLFDEMVSIADRFENVSDFRFLAYLCLSGLIADDKKNAPVQLKKLQPVLDELVKYSKQCGSILEQDKTVERCPLVLEEHENDTASEREVLIIELNESYFYISDFLEALYNFAVNDEIKFEIYENYRMKDSIEVLLLNGNNAEKEFALKLLWQLCFDKRVSKDVQKRKSLTLAIDEMISQREGSDNKRLIFNAKGVEFLLKGGGKKVDVTSARSKPTNHIMISYNSKSRETCLEIKKFLEGIGYKVWIDVESIYGSSLEAMANAIEQSFCVLICVTEKYKESNNCRLEAEYVIQQKKQYIPLFLETGYKPDGWLGLVIGSRIFIDLNKLGFDKAMNELKRCVDLVINENGGSSGTTVRPSERPKTAVEGNKGKNQQKEVNSTNSTNSNSVNSSRSSNEHYAARWSEFEVERWLNNAGIAGLIVKSVTPCDGQVLFQLYNMLKFNPEFFYSSLKISGMETFKDLKDIAYFGSEMKKLFEI